jgi:hypothetical protein
MLNSCPITSSSTTSTQSSVEPMESPRQACTNLSQQCLPMMVGTGLNTPSGEEIESPELKLRTVSPTSSLKLNRSSMEEIKESSHEFIYSDTLNLLLSDEHCESIDEAVFVEKLISLRKHANDWELKVDSKYSDEQAFVIDGLHNILLNKSNGFGDRNDQAFFEEMMSADTSGLLIKEATVGMKLSKKIFLSGHLFPFHYSYVNGKKKLKKKRRTMKWPRILDCDVESDDMDRLLQVDLASLIKATAEKKRRHV